MYAVYRKYTSLLPRSKAVGFDVGIEREGSRVLVHVSNRYRRTFTTKQSVI